MTQHAAPVRARWRDGVPVCLCQECWSSRDAECIRRVRKCVLANSRGDVGAAEDRVERATELAESAPFFSGTWPSGRDLLESARGELERVRTAWRQLPNRVVDRAYRAAVARHGRGDISWPHAERDPLVQRFLRLERDALERASFSGWMRAQEIPVEYDDWFFDSAVAGTWLPTTDEFGIRRIEPQIGGYLDHARHNSPPALCWGRRTHGGGRERGGGPWVTRQNRQRGWDASGSKDNRYLATETAQGKRIANALAAILDAKGLIDCSEGVDLERVAYMIHVRLCGSCSDPKLPHHCIDRRRKTYVYACFHAREDGGEGFPTRDATLRVLAQPHCQRLLFLAQLRPA